MKDIKKLEYTKIEESEILEQKYFKVIYILEKLGMFKKLKEYKQIIILIKKYINNIDNFKELVDLEYMENIQKCELEIEKILNDCNLENIKYITILNNNYPESLKNIYDPPKIIYYVGNISLLNKKIVKQDSIAIIGSRDCTNTSSYIANRISDMLVDKKYIIVSGLACGIDSVAHKAAVGNNYYTIGVLGTGIDNKSFYPKININLKNKIIQNNSLIISEYPPYTKGSRYTFPRRNRIIAGLSKSIIVVQAKIKSGSIITCNLALEQGKEVYAVIQNFESEEDTGNSQLVKDGAIPIISFKDINYYF